MTENIIRILAESAGISSVLRLSPAGGPSLYPESSGTEKDSSGNVFRVLKIRARFKGEEPERLFSAAEAAYNAFLSEECTLRLREAAPVTGTEASLPVLESCDGSGAYIVSFTLSLKFAAGASGGLPEGGGDGSGSGAVFAAGFRYESEGGSIDFSDGLFRLEKAEGTEPFAGHFTEENAFFDGAEYLSSHIGQRRITLHVRAAGLLSADRRRLYAAFRTGDEGTLFFSTGSDMRKIQCRTEKIVREMTEDAQKFKITLLCPSPLFENASGSVFPLCGNTDMWEFDDFELTENDDFEFSSVISRSATLISNGGDVPAGCVIKVTSERPDVSGIRITQKPSDKSIAVNTTLGAGDTVIFDTRDGSKSIIRTRTDDTSAREDITHLITEDSEFFKIPLGNSRIRISADGGIDGLSAEILFTERFEGI